MIAGIRGALVGFGAQKVYMEAGGLEYEIHVPLNVFDALERSRTRESVRLYIYHHFMQEEQRLYGFLDRGQREFFIALTSVKGLGTVLALSILSHLDASALLSLCEQKDVKALTRIPRVGKSTAETLIFEINRRLERWRKITEYSAQNEIPGDREEETDDEDLAVQALLGLGYKEKEARETLRKLTSGTEKKSASELIRDALRLL